MSYSNRFIMVVLVNGVPQKELANGEVHVPFGAYSLRLRNRHSRNAAVQIYIDGENVSGEGYRIPANDKVDIHRFADKDVSFKFVDLDSAEAAEFGKGGPNPDKLKGVVEARFFLEKESPKPVRTVEHHHHYRDPHPWRPYWSREPYWRLDLPYYDSSSAANITCSDGAASLSSSMCCSGGAPASLSSSVPSHAAPAKYDLREGATVEGHYTGQNFHKVHMDLEDNYVSIKVFLKGYDHKGVSATGPAPRPRHAGNSTYCENCGAQRTGSANFCGDCGHKHR